MTDNVLLIKTLKQSSFANLVFAKTQARAINWVRITSGIFQSELPTDDLWIVRSEKIISRSGTRYFLEMYKNGTRFVSLQNEDAEDVFKLVDRLTFGQPCTDVFTKALNNRDCCNTPKDVYFNNFTGGVALGGISDVLKLSPILFVQGGVRLGGIASGTTTFDIAEGGIGFGGLSIVDVYSDITGGGMVSGGTGEEEQVSSLVGLGGVEVAGLSMLDMNGDFEGLGGVLFGKGTTGLSEPFFLIYSPPTSGGTEVGGVAIDELVVGGTTYNEIGSGGVEASGDIIISQVHEVNVDEYVGVYYGIVLGGTAEVEVVILGQGGIVLGGVGIDEHILDIE